MKEPLSYFVRYIEIINKINLSDNNTQLNNELDSVLSVLSKASFNDKLFNELNEKKKEIMSCVEEFTNLLTDFKSSANAKLRNDEKNYLVKSYTLYEESKNDSPKYILDKSLFDALIHRDSVKEYFISRIQDHSGWKHAGMFIRPQHDLFVDKMTASDPLYIVDDHNDLLFPCKQLWNNDYQSRVRYKVIDESKSTIFKNFPKGQLGLIVAVNYFNHKPLEVIRNYFVEMYDLMTDGGTAIFTYNNCNLPIAVSNFEKMHFTYTPNTLLISLLEVIGFEIIEEYDHEETNVSWLEIKKPGTLNSIRGGQCLGRINI